MKPVHLVATGLLVLLLALVLLVNLPVRLFAEQQLADLDYSDLEGATLLSGDLWISLDALPGGLAHLVYNWCPGLSPLTWCLDLRHHSVDMNANIQFSDTDRLALSDVKINSLDISALGLAVGLVDARFRGEIGSIELPVSGCALRDMQLNFGYLQTGDIRIFGISTGPHRLELVGSQQSADGELSGDTFSGNIQLAQSGYSAAGEMRAPQQIETLARSLMTPLVGNRYGWEINGTIPW